VAKKKPNWCRGTGSQHACISFQSAARGVMTFPKVRTRSASGVPSFGHGFGSHRPLHKALMTLLPLGGQVAENTPETGWFWTPDGRCAFQLDAILVAEPSSWTSYFCDLDCS
jgi:hypothetical protein